MPIIQRSPEFNENFMAETNEITLTYFDLRGRAQFIRGLLTHREVPFIDKRIVLKADNSNWPEIRKDRSSSGPFQKVPTLLWGELMLNEVLVILDFLSEKLGDKERLSEQDRARHGMLSSSAFLDIITPCINLIWSDIFYPGTDVPATTAFMKRRLEMHLATVNQTLEEWNWLSALQERPVMAADAVLWEALDMLRLTFDDHVSFEELEALAGFYEDCPGAASFKKLLKAKHLNITGRPGEADALLVIHNSLTES